MPTTIPQLPRLHLWQTVVHAGAMGLKDWAKHRGMKQPVPGTFVVQDSYQHGSSIMLTGVLSAEGLPPRPAEVKIGLHDRWLHAASNSLPAILDAIEPTNFKILWDDVTQITQQQRARMVAERAAAQANGQQAPFGDDPSLLGGPMLAGLSQVMNNPHVLRSTSVSTSVTVNGVPVDMAGGLDVSGLLQSLSGLGAGAGAGSPEPATAVVLAAHDVPEAQWPAGLRPPAGYVSFALDVTGADGSTWSATALVGFKTPERRALVSEVGRSLPVLVDPRDRSRVAMDIQRFDQDQAHQP